MNPELGTIRRNNFSTGGHLGCGPSLCSLAKTQLEEVPAIQDPERCSAIGDHGARKGCRDHIPEGTAGGDVRVWASGPATGKVPGLGGTPALERRFLPPPNRQSEPGPPLLCWMAVGPLSERRRPSRRVSGSARPDRSRPGNRRSLSLGVEDR